MMNARGAIRWCTALCGTMSLCCDERGEGSGGRRRERERDIREDKKEHRERERIRNELDVG